MPFIPFIRNNFMSLLESQVQRAAVGCGWNLGWTLACTALMARCMMRRYRALASDSLLVALVSLSDTTITGGFL